MAENKGQNSIIQQEMAVRRREVAPRLLERQKFTGDYKKLESWILRVQAMFIRCRPPLTEVEKVATAGELLDNEALEWWQDIE